nr:biotin/lipoyl-binding protein [uncultured Blautia sp.]
MDKKLKIAVIGGGTVLVLGAGIWFGAKHFRKTTVPVYSMEELAQEVWGNTTSLEGSVSSNVSQQVRLMDKQIVSQVHVTEGQEVKEGDPLLTYDMTLVNIDLEMEKINKQQLEVKKKGLEQELKDLKNGKWSSVSANKEYNLDFLGGAKKEWKLVQTTAQEGNGEVTTPPEGNEGEPKPPTGEPDQPVPPEGGEGETTPPSGGQDQPVPPEGGDGETIPPSGEQGQQVPPAGGEGGTTPPSGEQGQQVLPEGGEGETNPPAENPDPELPPATEAIAYSRLYWDISLEDPIPPAAEDNVLVEMAVPYKQEGNTLYFLCKKDVWVQGAFLNQIAGFRLGEEKEEAPLNCVLEQHIEDKVEEPMLSQMTIYGEKIEERFKPDTWYRSKLGLSEWEEVPIPGVEEPGEDIFFPTPGDSIIGGYSQEELNKAIGEKEREIATAGLDIREADLKIKKVEQKLQDETIRSTINGVVKKVGDPLKGEINGEPFIVVESSGGVYIKGYLSEDMLGKVKPGQVVSGMAYESMMPFQAEVKEVSPYPADDYAMYNNREVTYYPFTAFIQDSTGLKDREMVTMDLPQEDGAISGIFLSKEYVRSKDGEDYVLKEGKNGKLVKQPVRTGRTFYGSLIEIKEGVTKEDYVAFPYGKKVKEGAKAKKSTLAELYGGY